jgi:hypothetical protein
MKSRNRGRQTRGGRIVLQAADGQELVLEEWEQLQLLRVLPPELAQAIRPGGTLRDHDVSYDVATASAPVTRRTRSSPAVPSTAASPWAEHDPTAAPHRRASRGSRPGHSSSEALALPCSRVPRPEVSRHLLRAPP